MYKMYNEQWAHRRNFAGKRNGSVPSSHPMARFREQLVEKLGSESDIIRSALAEFIGTFFLVLIGLSANIQQEVTGSSPITAQIAWGFGLAFGAYLSATVSGGHLNPAISLSALVSGDIGLGRFLVYVPSQLIGAFVGTAAAYLGHVDDINYLDNGQHTVLGRNATAGLFTTFPSERVGIIGALVDQIIGTAILALCVGLITDKKHRIPIGLGPLLVGFCLSMISMTYGANAGFAVNPARDLGPRLFLLCVGYGPDLFTARDYYFWVPIVGPFIGGVLGMWIYKVFVGIHGLNDEVEITKPQRDERGYKRYREENTEEPQPISWRPTAIPQFPDNGQMKSPPPLPPPHPSPQTDPYKFSDFQSESLRREPNPSPPPPPLPTSPPPPPIRSFVEELKNRHQNELRAHQEEQSLTLFAENEKPNGPVGLERLFKSPPPPVAAPRRLQTDRPEITVTLAYEKPTHFI